MSVDVICLEYAIDDLGSNLRRKKDLTSSEIVIFDKSKLAYFIQLDNWGEYTISLEDDWYKQTYQHEFYDGNTKIFEAYYDKNTQAIVIKCLTKKQTNLFFDFNAHECIIKAEGPLCIDGQFHIQTDLVISAPALCLMDTVQCGEIISLNIEQGIGLFGDIKANQFDLHAAYCHQAAHINVNYSDVTVQTFQQIANFNTQVNALRLVADQCEVNGLLEVNNQCFIVANTLLLGSIDTNTNIKLSGKNHLHFINGSIRGNTRFAIGSIENESEIKSNFFCDQQFFIHASATAEFYSVKINAHWVENSGHLRLQECLLDATTILQEGFFDSIDSDILVLEQYNQNEQSNTVFLRSDMSSDAYVISDGKILLQESKWKGNTASITSGLFEMINQSNVVLTQSLYTDISAHFSVIDSECQIRKMTLFGSFTLTKAEVEVSLLSSYVQSTISDSKIQATSHVNLSGIVDIDKSEISSNFLSLNDQVIANNLLVNSDKFKCIGLEVVMNQFIINANELYLEGGIKKNQNMEFTNSKLAAKIFSIRNIVHLTDSTLMGYDHAEMAHDIEGQLKLERSRIITESQIHHLVAKKHILLLDDSAIIAHTVYSEAKIVGKNSEIKCHRFLHQDAPINFKSSDLTSYQTFSLYHAQAEFKESKVDASDVILNQSSQLRLTGKSVLNAKHDVITHSTSTLTGQDSALRAAKFVTLGRVELCSSLLSANELFIYNEFDAQDKTLIDIENRILLAESAKVRFTDGHIETKRLDTFGKMTLEKSSLNAEEDIALWSSSETTLSSHSAIQSINLVISGNLELKKNDDVQTASAVQLQVAEQLDILTTGKIIGNEDLQIEANSINQMGEINLVARLQAKGQQFNNFGSVITESTYLGFDDAVINHFGLFSSKNITIHSNFFNFFGQVYATSSFASTGFLGTNMGLVAANNYTNDNLLSLNAGLILPNFYANANDIFSRANLYSVLKTSLMTIAPEYTNTLNLAFMVPSALYMGMDLYRTSQNFNVDQIMNKRRHELMPMACQIKNIAMFGKGAFDTSYGVYGESEKLATLFDLATHMENYKWSDIKQSAMAVDWKNIGIHGVGAFCGRYTDNSLINVNLGSSLEMNTTKSSLFDINFGAEYSFFSQNINTDFFYNSGYSGGGEASFSALLIDNNGTLEGTNHFSMHADKVDNGKTGIIEGKGAYLDIADMQQNGQVTIDGGRLNITVLNDNQEAHTTLTNVALSGKSLDLMGSLALENVLIQEDEHFNTSSSATLITDNVTIETKTFTHSGYLNYEHGLTIKADVATFEKGSEVRGEKTTEDKLFVPKQSEASTETDTETPKELEKEFKPQHVLNILADETNLVGKLSGGDYTQIQEKKADDSTPDDTPAAPMNNDVFIDVSADIDLKYGSITAKEMDNLGPLHLENFNLNLDSLHQGGEFNIEKSQLTINSFIDDTGSHTTLTDLSVKGSTMDVTGNLILKNVSLQEEDHFNTSSSANLITGNVTIETKTFTHSGYLNYEHGLTIKADVATFEKGSEVRGEKTTEDKLFVPKQSEASAETDTETPKELEKEFKPQHVLNILADETNLVGKLSGGDYTQIQEKKADDSTPDDTPAAPMNNDVFVDVSADIDLKYGDISANIAKIAGNVVLDNFNIAIKDGTFNQTINLKNSSYTGDLLVNNGSLNLDHSSVNVTDIHLTQQGHEQLISSTISSQRILDESQMSYQGQSGILTDSYEHTGSVNDISPSADVAEKNLFFVKAKTARLDGSTNLDNGYYDIEHLGDGTQFAAGTGKYSLYLSSDSLTFKTNDLFYLNDSINRHCDLTIDAADIMFGADYNQQLDLTFISAGNVALTNNQIQCSNFNAKSAGNIYMNGLVNTDSELNLMAAGGYYNYGGLLNGQDISVKASEIKNYTQGSVGASYGTVLPMGNVGMINARNNLFLTATQGNVEDHGGMIRAGNYAQILANNDVLNLCNTRTFQGQYDTLQQFDGGLISGGNGQDTDGIGLYIKAQGQVISDASDFISNGSNYIEGVHGVQFTAKSHTAITKNETTEKWYGKKKTVVDTSTLIKGCDIQSNYGRNIIQSGEGSVSSIASRFISPGGTDISAKGNVELFSLRTQDCHFESTSYLWGLTEKEKSSIYQSSTPTLFYDNGATRIHSSEGNVDARGAYFIGAGDLSIKAKGQVLFGVDILNHEVNEKTKAFSLSAPGLGAWNTYKHGGNTWDILTSEDATLAKMKSLFNSNNALEYLTNASNMGIDVFNTTNSIMRGFEQDGLTHELMARYGLGGEDGFSPSLTLSMTQSKTNTTYQTQGQGGVDRGGNIQIEAGEGVILENGVRVHADGKIDINAPELIARAAELHSTMKQTTTGESVGLTANSQIQSVGASFSKTETNSTNYVNAELSANGNIYLHYQDKAMELVELDGANLIAGTLDANINRLIIRDKQDMIQTKTESFSVSSSGQLSAYVGKGLDYITNKNSGIHVIDGINTNGHVVHVVDTLMIGGKITTEGENHFASDHLQAIELKDVRSFNGVGISVNLNDINRLIDGKPTNKAGEQAIATSALTIDHIDYQATHQTVIYGDKGTALDIKQLEGEIHTSSVDGVIVEKDSSMHIQVDIPITNKDYLDIAADNIKAGEKKLIELFKPAELPKEPMAFGRPEPIKPVEDEDEHHKRKKGTPTNDDELSPEEAQELINQTLAHLQFESPEQEQEFKATMKTAETEMKQNGHVSPKTEKKVKKAMTEAVVKTLKEGSEESWGQLIKQLGSEYDQSLIKLFSKPETIQYANVKISLLSKGIGISFIFNLGLSYLDPDVENGDELLHGAVTTGVDASFNGVLSLILKDSSGPLGLLLAGFNVVDSFYNQERVDESRELGMSYLNEAQRLSREGHPFDAWVMRQFATDQLGVAAKAQAAHSIANLTTPIVDLIEKQIKKNQEEHNKPTNALPSPSAKVSKQGLFKLKANNLPNVDHDIEDGKQYSNG